MVFQCSSDNSTSHDTGIDYREEMRSFVIEISKFSKSQNPGFIVIPQNGHELLSQNGEPDGMPATSYLAAIDALGQEDFFYGYEGEDIPTKVEDTKYINDFLKIGASEGKEVLITDYISIPSKVDDSIKKNSELGYLSFAAYSRGLNSIPRYPVTKRNENANDITSISQAKNFLYLLDDGEFESKESILHTISQTNYDVVIMDAFYDTTTFSTADLEIINTKKNGGERLLIAYMSIGEAGDFRYYWKDEWEPGTPTWLDDENPNWEGNFKVKYWDSDWQKYIYGNDNSYLQRILDAGFDGVYLDIIDAFWYYENQE
tara:strand:- start:17336 stop:18283 length:948 start_codon:yes stop_codon:yes gene_type:complete